MTVTCIYQSDVMILVFEQGTRIPTLLAEVQNALGKLKHQCGTE